MLKNINLHGKLPVILAGFLFTFFMCFIYVYKPEYLSHLNHKIYDTILKVTHDTKDSGAVVIIDLDEKSMKRFGQWPWARYRIAILLEKIRGAGAICVGMDILFAESDRTSPRILKENLKKDLNVDIEFKGLPEALLDNDKIFADILKKGRYVLGFFFDDSQRPDAVMNDLKYAIRPVVIKEPGASDPLHFLYESKGAVFPVSELSKAASGMGFINSRPEDDGIIRSAPLLMAMNGNMYPCLALSVLRSAMGNPPVVVKMTKGGIESLKVGKSVIPVDKNGRMFLNFRGGSHTFQYFSARDVMEGKLPENSLMNKIVLIGTSAAGLKDLRATPLDPLFPGVEAQATIIDNILSKDFFLRPDWTPGLELSLIAIFGIITAIFIAFSSPLWTLPLVVVSAYGVWYGGVWSFENWRIFISPLFPFIMLAGNFSFLSFLKFWNTEREKGFIRNTFGRYLSDSIVQQILDTPGGMNLGGEKKIVTIMMTDLRGFTAICERLAPEDVVSIVNNYLRNMTPIIGKYGGTIDEFIGDAILAIFGAPISKEDDVKRAVACAVEMQNAMQEVNRINLEGGLPQVEQGIGLHTGEAIIGNIGSELRSKYGIVGKNVNFTARVESYTVGGQIYISKETRNEIGDILKVNSQMEVKPKGVKEPTTIYEITGIGGKYNVYMPEKESVLFEVLTKTVHLNITVLEGKHAGEDVVKGKIIEMAGMIAKVQSDLPVNPLDNFKMSLEDENGIEITADLYGKAVEIVDNSVFIINFTSVPPEAKEFFSRLFASGE